MVYLKSWATVTFWRLLSNSLIKVSTLCSNELEQQQQFAVQRWRGTEQDTVSWSPAPPGDTSGQTDVSQLLPFPSLTGLNQGSVCSPDSCFHSPKTHFQCLSFLKSRSFLLAWMWWVIEILSLGKGVSLGHWGCSEVWMAFIDLGHTTKLKL